MYVHFKNSIHVGDDYLLFIGGHVTKMTKLTKSEQTENVTWYVKLNHEFRNLSRLWACFYLLAFHQ